VGHIVCTFCLLFSVEYVAFFFPKGVGPNEPLYIAWKNNRLKIEISGEYERYFEIKNTEQKLLPGRR
jgi:hypothetical protein